MSPSTGNCAGCGEPLAPNKNPGRPRKWCSEDCRRHTLYSGTCVDCGASTYNGTVPPPERCQACATDQLVALTCERSAERKVLVEQMWTEGKTYREIGAVLGWKGKFMAANVGNLRARGYNLPHRNLGAASYMADHGAEHMALARAARKAA